MSDPRRENRHLLWQLLAMAAGSFGFGSLACWRAAMTRAAWSLGLRSCLGTGYWLWTEPSCEYVYWLP